MKIQRTGEKASPECIERIESHGMMEMAGVWVAITVIVYVRMETQKAYYGDVRITTDDIAESIYSQYGTWIPKSMASNCWWICTVKFGHAEKVANRRWPGYD